MFEVSSIANREKLFRSGFDRARVISPICICIAERWQAEQTSAIWNVVMTSPFFLSQLLLLPLPRNDDVLCDKSSHARDGMKGARQETQKRNQTNILSGPITATYRVVSRRSAPFIQLLLLRDFPVLSPEFQLHGEVFTVAHDGVRRHVPPSLGDEESNLRFRAATQLFPRTLLLPPIEKVRNSAPPKTRAVTRFRREGQAWNNFSIATWFRERARRSRRSCYLRNIDSVTRAREKLYVARSTAMRKFTYFRKCRGRVKSATFSAARFLICCSFDEI